MVFTDGIELQARVARGSEVVYAERSVTFCAEAPCELERGAAPPEASAEASRSYATALTGAAPNPARGSATVRFTLAEAADVRVVVYDPLGREVARLVDGALEEGEHEARFDGASLPAGVYVVRMTADGGAFAASQRLTLIR